jgi:copper chaperone
MTNSTTTTYAVVGLTCEHCANAVSTELRAVHGVEAVSVDLVPSATSRVTVTSAEPLTDEQVTEALDEAGDYRLAPALS